MPKRDAVQEMRQEVIRLRKEGWAFSKVARKLAISKSYAVKLSHALAEPPPGEEAGTSTTLTVRERRFAAGLLEGKNQRQAAIEAGAPPAGADAFANRTLRNLKFQGAFHEMLAQAGLSEEAIVRVHAENLVARKVVAYATKDGRITDVIEGPNYAVRQRAVTDAWRLHDRLVEKGRVARQNRGSVIVRVSPENARMMEKLRGEPLPNTIEVEPEQSIDEATAPPVAATPGAALDVPPKPESKSAAGSTQTKSPKVPPLPRDAGMLTWRQARDLARLRGEPERTVNIFASMGPYDLVISGQTYKQLCGEDEGSRATGVSQST